MGAPFSPAEADIATVILTNVIEHLVWLFTFNKWLFTFNKHAFTAKAVWSDFMRVNIKSSPNWDLVHIPTEVYFLGGEAQNKRLLFYNNIT